MPSGAEQHEGQGANGDAIRAATDLVRAERYRDAAELLDEAVRRMPGNARVHYLLGVCLHRLGALERAIEHYERAVRIAPRFTDAIGNLAIAQAGLGSTGAALANFERVYTLDPDDAVNRSNLGHLLYRANRLDEAEPHLRAAVRLNPDMEMAWSNLGDLHRARGEWARSAECYRHALSRNPLNGPVISNLVYALRTLCLWDEIGEWQARLLTISDRVVHDGGASPVDPFVACFLPISRGSFLSIARSHGRKIASDVKARGLDDLFTYRESAIGKVRIGYASAKFSRHARGYLVEDMFRHHDRSRVEVFGYGLRPSDGSETRTRIEAGFDRFRDLSDCSDRDAASIINEDEIDVLVDFDGLSAANRTMIFAMRPAPIQVAYLAFPGTSGTDHHDYIIGDPVVTPPEHANAYTETIVRLPHCYQVNNHRNHSVPDRVVRRNVGLPDDRFVYCCLNVSRKVDRQSFLLWMRILKRVDESVLWLLIDGPGVLDTLRAEGEALGVDPLRILPAPRLDVDDHLARCEAADVFLDTLVYNAHTSGSDSLWAGTPLVTLIGEKFPSRVGASLCRAAGIPETVCSSEVEYEEMAAHLAEDPGALQRIHKRLVTDRYDSPLFDTRRLVLNLEQAFLAMAELHRQGREPHEIDVVDMGPDRRRNAE